MKQILSKSTKKLISGNGGEIMNLTKEAAFKAYNKSKELDILSAPPENLILKIYDYILNACKKEKADEACKGIALLIDSLNFEETLSLNLFQLYRYTMEKLKAGEFEEPINIISGLKEAWETATT